MVSWLHVSRMMHHSLRYLHWRSSRFWSRTVPGGIRDGVVRDTHPGANPHPRRKHETFLPRMGNLTPMRSWKRGHALAAGHNVLKTRAVRAVSLTRVENKSKINPKIFGFICHQGLQLLNPTHGITNLSSMDQPWYQENFFYENFHLQLPLCSVI